MSIKINRKTKTRITLVVSFFAFFFAGLDSLDQHYMVLAISNFLLAGANIIGLFFIKEGISPINIILLMLNACLAFMIAYGYFDVGKKALPIAWLVVGFLYIAATFIMYRRSKLSHNN